MTVRCMLFRRMWRSRLVTILVAVACGFFLGVFYATQGLQYDRTRFSRLADPDTNSAVDSAKENKREELEDDESLSVKNSIPPPAQLVVEDIWENIDSVPVNYNVSVFYYAWYANPTRDGRYAHWNHKRMPHWIPSVAARFSQKIHIPPADIGSNYYPYLGLYSSQHTGIIHKHMKMIRATGIGVIIYSWYPKGLQDTPGTGSSDLMVKTYLDFAHKNQLKLALHIEPYKGRTETTVLSDIQYIHRRYAKHPAYYRRARTPRVPTGKNNSALPVIYIYDSYRIEPHRWNRILGNRPTVTNDDDRDASLSVRGTAHDVFAIGLYLSRDDCTKLSKSGFDAAYTYFASETMSDGSASSNWLRINQSCAEESVQFHPSLGPGYLDTAVRPWNSGNTKFRRDGAYFRRQFWNAMAARPSAWSVTSFNEWHEGTQIEPAIPKKFPSFTYSNYLPNSPEFYLRLTQRFVQTFTQIQCFNNVTIPSPNPDK